MSIATFTSRQFNQDTGRAKKAALNGPVFITDRGEPAHVLLNFEEYQRLVRGKKSIAQMLSSPEAADIELELPERRDYLRPVDLD